MAATAGVVAAAREQISSYRGGSGLTPLHGVSSVWMSFDFDWEFGVMWMKNAPRLVALLRLLGLLGLVAPLWGVSMERSLPLLEDPDPERHSCCWCNPWGNGVCWHIRKGRDTLRISSTSVTRHVKSMCELLVEMGKII